METEFAVEGADEQLTTLEAISTSSMGTNERFSEVTQGYRRTSHETVWDDESEVVFYATFISTSVVRDKNELCHT